MISYTIYFRSRGRTMHSEVFQAEDDSVAKGIAGVVFYSCVGHWDAFDLWDGDRLVGGPIAEKLDRIAMTIANAAVAVEESMQLRNRQLANDEKLSASIRKIRSRRA